MSETPFSLRLRILILICGALLARGQTVFSQQGAPSPPSPAQPSAQASPTQTILKNTASTPPDEINLRTLDLIALDDEGRTVADLKTEDLRLFENKIEQKILTLSPTLHEPLTLGLFFDISASRRADHSVGEETRLASEFVHSIWQQGDTAFVMAFNDAVYAVTQPSQKLEDIDEGLKKIGRATFRGGTALYDALCSMKPEKLAKIPGRKVYVVFSDFEDNLSQNTSDHVVEIAQQVEVSIFPFILAERRSEGNGSARKLAQATGGEVLISESGKQLASTFAQLASALQATYRMTYMPSTTGPTEKKKKKKILLQTTRPHLRLIYPKA